MYQKSSTELCENYSDHFQDLTSELCDLEGKIFDAYIEQKGEPLLAYVEPGLTMGDFKWHNCLPPKGNVLQLGNQRGDSSQNCMICTAG